jgi:hypothetical protein
LTFQEGHLIKVVLVFVPCGFTGTRFRGFGWLPVGCLYLDKNRLRFSGELNLEVGMSSFAEPHDAPGVLGPRMGGSWAYSKLPYVVPDDFSYAAQG